MSETMTRREFVAAGAALGVGIAVVGVAGCAPQEESAVDTPTFRFEGDAGMGKRVLVGYATRTGSTIGVAEAIGRTLGERGYQVDVAPLRERPSLDGYDACVLGSAINGGQWLPEAVSWVEGKQQALGAVPVALFCVHSMNGGSDEKQTRKRLAYLDRLRELVTPTSEGFFLGKGPTAEDSSLIARWAFKAFGGSAEGDARDWDKIGAWATAVQL